MKKHATLKEKEYYDVKKVGSGRKDKVCEHCTLAIPVGEAHEVHYFTPDTTDPEYDPNSNQKKFRSYPTHFECSEDFISSLT